MFRRGGSPLRGSLSEDALKHGRPRRRWTPRYRPRLYIPLLLLLGAVWYVRREYYRLWDLAMELPVHWRYNIAQYHTPDRLKPLMRYFIPCPEGDKLPPFYPDIYNATWAGSWPAPILSPPRYEPDSRDPVSPAFLMLHVFSTSQRGARLRREFIRNHSPWNSVPDAYKHLVEIKFVLGVAPPLSREELATEEGMARKEEYAEEDKMIKEEIATYGDIIRLENLKGGDNMNEGKSLEWVRWVGRRKREAQWVLKCDDDTMPILPNLLAFLAQQDAGKPTYLGTSLGHWTGYPFYFEGMMYGFSWGVVKTLATANIKQSFIQEYNHEDGWMGIIITNLPSYPLCPPSWGSSLFHADRTRPRRIDGATSHALCVQEQLPFDSPPPGGWGGTPRSPDPRTGLIRLDFGPELGAWDSFAIPKTKKSVGWHNLKSEESYIQAYRRAHDLAKAEGREYMWKPPRSFEAYAQRT